LVNTAKVGETGREAGRGVREQLHRLEGRLRERRERHREGGMGESDKGGGGCFEEDLERLLEKHLA